MNDIRITEAETVQFPMVRHATEIGWTPISPQDALALRGSEAELLLQRLPWRSASPVQPLDDGQCHTFGD